MSKPREAVLAMVGRVAEWVAPSLGREIDEARNNGRAPRLKRAILFARLRRAQARGDVPAIERALAQFWAGSPGDKFHGHYAAERLKLFRESHAEVIDQLTARLDASGARFSRLVEIGCGDGSVLTECLPRLPWVSQAVGLDINAAVIAQASTDYAADSRRRFVNAEAREWLAANPQPGTVVMAYGGVLEYVSQENFDGLLQVLSQAAPAAIVLVEPVAPEHDLADQPDSFVFGHERSFSHNHRKRLEAAEFSVVFERQVQAWDVRWMLMIGVRP